MSVKSYFALALLAALYYLSEHVFEPLHLYYLFPWIDIPMHLLGGSACGIFFYYLLTHKGRKDAIILSLLGTLVVALLWEFYEYAIDFANVNTWNGWPDTLTDIMFGILGGYGTILLIRNTNKNEHI